MRFSKHTKALEASLKTGNWFFQNMPDVRRGRFRKAFGLQASRSPARLERNSKGEPIDGVPKHYYNEDFTADKKFVIDTLDFYATRIGATLSQVVHAVVTGDRESLAKAVSNNVHKHIEAYWEQVYDEQKAEMKKHRRIRCTLVGLCYKGNPERWKSEDFEKAVESQWPICLGVLTQQERAIEAMAQERMRASEAGVETMAVAPVFEKKDKKQIPVVRRPQKKAA